MRFDGWQEFESGRERQYTALEDVPDLVPQFGTTYASTIRARGYRIEEAA